VRDPLQIEYYLVTGTQRFVAGKNIHYLCSSLIITKINLMLSNSISHSDHPEALKLSFRNIMEPLLVLFNKATAAVLPGASFYIAYSIPGGVYGYFTNYTVSDQDIKNISEYIKAMILNKQLIEHKILSKDQMIQYFEPTNRADIVRLLRSGGTGEKGLEDLRLAHVNGYGEFLLNHVSENYDKLAQFQLFRHNRGFFLVADPEFYQRVMPARVELSKYFKRFEESEVTNKQFGIADFASLNEVITAGELPEFIKLAEAWQTRRLSYIADNILSHPLKPRIIFLAGPTSSGKTTTANRLAIELKVLGREVIILSLDNYYLPHTLIPNDPITGLKNFEQISALDTGLFMNNIHDLVANKPVYLPKYFFDGKGPKPQASTTRINPGTFIIVEGIHGLNPELWKHIMDMDSYRLYVSALTTLNIHDHLPFSTSDHRLIRRLVRDHMFRGYDFNDTIQRWPDVMQNEYNSIFTFQESAHSIFNSALIYEIAVFAFYAQHILRPEEAINEQIREEAKRLIRILSLLIPIDPSGIPPTSIIREFIGGSSFNY
jgi:uridine kinase